MSPRARSIVCGLAVLLGGAAHADSSPFVFTDRAQPAGLGAIAVNSPTWYGAGVAFADFDGDDWPDLYFGAEQGARNVFCRNRRDGTFACSPVDAPNPGAVLALAAGDYDGDGDLDLYVMRTEQNALLRNDGHGNFTDVTAALGASGDPQKLTPTGTFLDFDGDGRLDLYLGHWYGSAVLPQARDQLLRQGEGGTFTDVTAAAGVDDQDRSTLAMAAFDYDGDGWQDLYVTGDGSLPLLFHNDAGHFRDVTTSQPLPFQQTVNQGMGIAIADFNGDGGFDLYVTNSHDPQVAMGSALFVHQPDGTFASLAAQYGVQAQFEWGTVWADFDNDGWPDILAVSDEADHFFLYRNLGGMGFELQGDLAAQPYGVSQSCVSVAAADYDHDGKVDLVIARIDGEMPQLLHNETASGNHWLAVSLSGDARQPDPLGALVEVSAGGTTYRQQLLGQTAKGAQNDRWLTFGLGTATSADVHVVWPTGRGEEQVRGLSVDRGVVIGQGRGLVRDWQGAGGGCSLSAQRPPGGPWSALAGLLLAFALARRAARRR